jgi:PAS domain S-box-containing protein
MTKPRGSTQPDRAGETVRVHENRELPESETYLRSLPDAVSFGIVLYDAAGRITYANPAAERLLGLTLAQIQRTTPADPRWRVVDETGAPLPLERMPSTRARHTREPAREVVMGIYTGTEQARWLRVDAVPVLAAGGEVREVVVSFIDITDRRRSEVEREQLYAEARAARAAEELRRARLTQVFTQAPVAIAVLGGPEHIFESANAYYLALVGNRDVVGLSARVVLPALEEQGFIDILDRVYATGERFVGREMKLRYDRDGSGVVQDVYFNFVYEPLREPDGRVSGIVAVILDVTDLVRARHEAEVARAEAEAANAAKSQFLATMSHEIRTPINAMLGYTQLIEMGIAGAVSVEQHGYLARMRQSAEHLLTLVDEVLDVAKLDAGQMAVGREPAMTGTAIAAAIALTLPQAQAKGIRVVHVNAGAAGSPFVGDEQRVRQILLNLLSNAIKFTPAAGTVTVRSGSTEHDPRGGRAAARETWTFIQVEDTGAGIAREQQGKIFEPFHQGESGHTRRAGGTGLGLTISRRLARLMGGELTFESEPGRGSTFTLWLPTAVPGAEVLGAEVAPHDAREEATRRAHGLAEAGRLLRDDAVAIQNAYVARLRSDPLFPSAQSLDVLTLVDHQGTFLASVADSLISIAQSDGLAQSHLRDGSEIQRAVSELHGRQRSRIGWNSTQFAREYDILTEEIEMLLRRRLPEGQDGASAAIVIVRQLITRARELGMRAHRHAEMENRSE